MREDAEGRALARKLVELGNATAEVVLAVRVRPDDLDLAHRQRGAARANGAEAAAARLGLLEQVEVDLDVVDLLHAPDVRVAPRLVGVDERTRHPEARSGVDDLLAVDVAVAARHLVLDPERELDPCWSFLHDPIVFTVRHPPQDLTSRRFSGSGDTRRRIRMAPRQRSVAFSDRGTQGSLRVARARAAHDRAALPRAPAGDARVRPRRALARPARLADRRGDGARRRAHGTGDRRLPQRDVRQRAGAHHRADRRERWAHGGRARLTHGKRRSGTSCSSSAPRSWPVVADGSIATRASSRSG